MAANGDSRSQDEDDAIQAAYALLQETLNQADRQGIAPPAMTSALLDVMAQLLVQELGHQGAADVLQELIVAIEEGRFDPDQEDEEEDEEPEPERRIRPS